MNLKLKFSDPSRPMYGFHSDGICAYSRTEVMGDPCQLLPAGLWDSWCIFQTRHCAKWNKWRTVWFMGVPMKVIVTGSDGSYWGCAIDTATVVRMLRTDLGILREGYGQ